MSNFNRPNFLQNGGYQLIIPRFRDTYFFTHTFMLPEIQLPAASADTPFSRMALAGDKMTFSPIAFNFYVDEELKNYTQIAEWLFGIGYVTEFADYTNYPNKGEKEQVLGEQDISIIVLNSKNNPIKTFKFVNAIPVSLGGFDMTSQDNSVNYVSSQVVFEYDYFEILDSSNI